MVIRSGTDVGILENLGNSLKVCISVDDENGYESETYPMFYTREQVSEFHPI